MVERECRERVHISITFRERGTAADRSLLKCGRCGQGQWLVLGGPLRRWVSETFLREVDLVEGSSSRDEVGKCGFGREESRSWNRWSIVRRLIELWRVDRSTSGYYGWWANGHCRLWCAHPRLRSMLARKYRCREKCGIGSMGDSRCWLRRRLQWRLWTREDWCGLEGRIGYSR